MAEINLPGLIITTTVIFLIALVFLLIYVLVYNRRKKRHIDEKAQMQLDFDAELVKTQAEVQEQTMQTIGTDLHDNIGQLLSLSSITLNSVDLDDRQKTRQKIEATIDLIGHSIKEMRLLGKVLQGEQLVTLGLADAIQQQVNWVEKSDQYGIAFTCTGEMPATRNQDKDLIVFRIVQEMLNNIIKHARASQINISLSYHYQQLHLQVSDNGIGFDAAAANTVHPGLGLHNIKKRAGLIGGTATIESVPGNGTCITVYIPYP